LNRPASLLRTGPDGGDAGREKNSELLQRFKEIDTLPEEEQTTLIKVISAYIRDFKAKQAYAS